MSCDEQKYFFDLIIEWLEFDPMKDTSVVHCSNDCSSQLKTHLIWWYSQWWSSQDKMSLLQESSNSIVSVSVSQIWLCVLASHWPRVEHSGPRSSELSAAVATRTQICWGPNIEIIDSVSITISTIHSWNIWLVQSGGITREMWSTPTSGNIGQIISPIYFLNHNNKHVAASSTCCLFLIMLLSYNPSRHNVQN